MDRETLIAKFAALDVSKLTALDGPALAAAALEAADFGLVLAQHLQAALKVATDALEEISGGNAALAPEYAARLALEEIVRIYEKYREGGSRNGEAV